MVRVAVLDADRCVNGESCDFLCGHVCPVNRAGKDCIVLPEDGLANAKRIPVISEDLCIGCNICVMKCPVECISIENTVQELSENPIQRYGENAFRIYRLPTIKKGQIVGLIGRNGIGKSTIMKILAGVLIPNLGDWTRSADAGAVIEYFKGREMQNYFKELRGNSAKVSYKPQNIADIPKAFKGQVKALLKKVDERKQLEYIVEHLNLSKILDRNLADLSGGELQRVAIAAACLKNADFYSFDEPTSFLDVRERLNSAKVLHSLAFEGKSLMVIEHDLAVLDYLSDYVNLLYGKKSVYGIVSNPKTVKNGINEFLDGYVKDENVRFRKEELKFEVKPSADFRKKKIVANYLEMRKKLGSFTLEIKPGELREAEVLGILGPNGIGKTTFVKMLSGAEKPDMGSSDLKLKVSYKPQYVSAPEGMSVDDYINSQELDFSVFRNEIDRRLSISELGRHRLSELSGGELQKVAVGVALSRVNSDLILLDEPTAFVDVEDRLNMAHAIRSIADSRKKIIICVDHDILFQDYVSDRLIVFEGESSVHGVCQSPMTMRDGMNHFLRHMQISFRRDHETGRPRVNKEGSQLDQEQKSSGEYYYVK